MFRRNYFALSFMGAEKTTLIQANGQPTHPSPITEKELRLINSPDGLKNLLQQKEIDVDKILLKLNYEDTLSQLQIELLKLQRDVYQNRRRVVIIFEGRDAAGKGGNIRRFIEHLNPRSMRVIALDKPTVVEQGQWYFRRYINTLPNPGEIAFYDRSWYNRAVIEPAMGFCTPEQYEKFLLQVPKFEHMLYEDGVEIIKFWLSISKEEQNARFEARKEDPLKRWKLSPIDEMAQENWDLYTKYKERMFAETHLSFSPWIIIKANDKKKARLETIRFVLNELDYEGKEHTTISLLPDPKIAMRFRGTGATNDK